jgi:hypothetical protein
MVLPKPTLPLVGSRLCCLGLGTSIFLISLLGTAKLNYAQKFEANYDECKVPSYQLPPLIDSTTNNAADFAAEWSHRRTELLQIFSEQMFGFAPTSPYELKCTRVEAGESLHGKAFRQQWHVTVSTSSGELTMELLVYTPAKAQQPVPCFLGLNFSGNHTVAQDEQIPVTTSWVRENPAAGTKNHQASDAGRGTGSLSWPVEQIVDAGLGVATTYYGDIDPDFDDNFQNGIHALFPQHRPSTAHPERWGSIAAWGWGLSRLLDCLSDQVKEVDGSRVAVIGHSRLGKTALWAGASDSRFAAVISNNSGCGGAALSRRAFGETIGRINTSFPHWFCPNFKQYNANEDHLPIDQHQLLALIAPRLVYVASASEDQWADPTGEFMSLNLASEIYRRLPAASNAKVGDDVQTLQQFGYHLRQGKHAINAWDWAHYIRFIQQL